MIKVKRQNLWCPVYNVNVRLFYGCDFTTFKKYMAKYHKTDVSMDVDDVDVKGQVSVSETGFEVFLADNINVHSVAHECIHLAMTIFLRCNISVGMDFNKHEHFAYYAAYWVKILWKIVEK